MTEQDIKRQAVQYLIELETTGTSDEAWARFEAWLREAPIHREVFSKLEKAWGAIGPPPESLPSRRIGLRPLSPPSLPPQVRLARRVWRVKWRAFIGLVILLMVGASFPYIHPGGTWADQETGPNDIRVVKLSDDSTVILNNSSKLAVRSKWWFAKEIHVERGEAVVDTTSHWYSPLVTYAGQAVLRDIGTRFDVLFVSDTKVKTTVERGTVDVTTAADARGHPLERIVRLQAGQSASIQGGEIIQETVSDQELSRRFAWAKGLLIFDGTLADAVAEFNRYNDKKLVVVDSRLLSTHVGGRYRKTAPDVFAKYLYETHGISSKVTGNIIQIGVRQ